jgi:thioredoxin-related protein
MYLSGQQVRQALNIICLLFVTFFTVGFHAYGQQKIQSVQMKHVDGTQINSLEVFTYEQPILIVFWATWCNHTSTGLSDIQDDYLDHWLDEFDLKIIVISVDDVKTSNRAVSMANSNGWDFDVYLDVNGEFRRALGVNSAPHVILLNSQGEMVWQQPSYMPGDEEVIQQKLEELK